MSNTKPVEPTPPADDESPVLRKNDHLEMPIGIPYREKPGVSVYTTPVIPKSEMDQ